MSNKIIKSKIKLGLYEHFKGGKYRVIGVAKYSETLEDLVVYEALYDNPRSKLWVRPLDDFIGYKELNGEKIKRFKFISEE